MANRPQRIWNRIKKGWEYKPEEYYHRLKAFLNPNSELRWEEFMHLRIRVFHSLNHKEVAQICFSGQQHVLEEFNVDGISSARKNAWENQNTYLFVLEHVQTGRIGGGMRLDVADPDTSLPIERALKPQCEDISRRIHRFDNVIAETCGLWIHKEFSERKLAQYLMMAAIAISSKLRIKVLVGLANSYSLNMTMKLGFTVAKTVGNNGGQFYYPNENYLSTVVELDSYTLNTVTEKYKEQIISLRENPLQTVIKHFKGYHTRIDYDLRLM
jgi:hypothetical protein